jgi:hypothetical protein
MSGRQEDHARDNLSRVTTCFCAQTSALRRGDSAALNKCAILCLHGSISTCS